MEVGATKVIVEIDDKASLREKVMTKMMLESVCKVLCGMGLMQHIRKFSIEAVTVSTEMINEVTEEVEGKHAEA